MSCTNIYGVVSSPSGRQRASKLTNLRHGIYWQKFIIILSLRRNVGAWELSVELRAQGEKGSLRCFCSDFLVQEVRGTEMCRHWGSWEHSGPSALASAVIPLHSPSSSKLHWFWEKFEEQLEILAGNPAKRQSTRHGQCTPGLLSRLFDRNINIPYWISQIFYCQPRSDPNWKLMTFSSGNRSKKKTKRDCILVGFQLLSGARGLSPVTAHMAATGLLPSSTQRSIEHRLSINWSPTHPVSASP